MHGMDGMPDILIIAGPNGAGKTTFAREYLPKEAGLARFVNADLIAEGLSPFSPSEAIVRAGRLMIEQIDRLFSRRESFAFETTLSGMMWVKKILEWKKAEYKVKVIFLTLPDADMAVRRVAARVKQGGHDVPEETIRRRFIKGLRNFQEIYSTLVDAWSVYDNSVNPPVLLSKGGLHVR